MTRSSKHTLLFTNSRKRKLIADFLSEYQEVGQYVIDMIWKDGYDSFNVNHDYLRLPKFIDYKRFEAGNLSARAMSSLCKQVVGMISATTEKRRKLLWLKEKLLEEGKSIDKVLNRLRKTECVKPSFPMLAELSSKCAILEDSGSSFDWFLELHSLGKSFGKILVPLKKTVVSNKWEAKGKKLGSFLVAKDRVEVRFQSEVEPKKGKTVGADQGLNTVLTLSNGGKTPQCDCHGHSLSSICDKIARKKKGGKAFKRAKAHRKNFIHWSVNQLDFVGLGKIKLEKVTNINFGRRASRKMQAWTNTIIRDKVIFRGEELGVQVILQDSTYRSQRCSECGNTRKANRKGKIYLCKHCGNVMDADENAAKNHELELPDISHLRGQKLNLKNGFFWNFDGAKTYDGQELRVPGLSKKE